MTRNKGRTFCLVGFVVAGISCTDEPTEPTSMVEEAATLSASAAAALSFYQLSAGSSHTCGIASDGRLFCWGYNASGQIGDGTQTDRWTPVPVDTELRFRQVSAGQSSTCAVTTAYLAYCWGAGSYGVLGNGSTTDHLQPTLVSGGRQYRWIESNFYHTCAVGYADSRAYCWGTNSQGELGNSTTTGRLTPGPVAGTIRFNQVTTGDGHSCGVTSDSRAYCWGDNREGQLGIRTEVARRLSPTLVADGYLFRQVDAGDSHTCGVTTARRAYCWGNGREGQIGNGKAYLSFWPRAVAGGILFDRVTAGLFHTCGESTTNKAYCWGNNIQGQLGDGTITKRLTPTLIPNGHFYVQLTAGEMHSCGRTESEAHCWGFGMLGRLGNGTENQARSPTRVSGTM